MGKGMNEMKCLFLHGMAGAPDDIRTTADLLPGFSISAPQVPYFDEQYQSIEELAEAVRSTLPPELLDEDVLLAGNSLGGALALCLGGCHHRIVLVSSHIHTSTGRISRKMSTLHQELARVFHDPSKLSKERVRRYEEMWKQFTSCRKRFRRLGQLKRMAEGFDYHGRYRALQERIALICGRHDPISPLEAFHELRSIYPAMDMHVIEDCAHAIPLEEPVVLAGIFRQVSSY
jgi:pimeloyl-ACP methyl ester carboxylesterase